MSQVAATFKLDYSLLYSALCSTLRDDQTTLLLYLLIHRNIGVKAFIFSRTNIDLLVSPSVCLCLPSVFVSLSLCLSVYLYLSLSLSLCLSVCLSVCLFLSLSVSVYLYLSLSQSVC